MLAVRRAEPAAGRRHAQTGLKGFEFCQNYTMFWDKFERANYFLEAIIETASATWTTGPWRSCWSRWRVTADSGTCSSIIVEARSGAEGYMPETQSSANTGADEHGAAACCGREPRRCARPPPGGVERPGREGEFLRIYRVCASTSARRRSASTGSGPTRTSSSTAMACSRRRNSPRSTWISRSRTTCAWSTIPARRARLAGHSRSTISATCSAARGHLPQCRHVRDQGHCRADNQAASRSGLAATSAR